MKNKKLLLGGLLLLGVGFAAVTTTLYINGTTNIKADTQGFEDDVVFADVTVADSVTDPEGQTTVEVSSDKKTITFTTHKLKSIGETVTISYKVDNKSQYGAKLGNLTCTAGDATADTYLSVAPANTLNNTTLAKNTTSDTDTVVITMIKSFAGGEGETEKAFTYSCQLPVTAVESN